MQMNTSWRSTLKKSTERPLPGSWDHGVQARSAFALHVQCWLAYGQPYSFSSSQASFSAPTLSSSPLYIVYPTSSA